MEKRRYMVIYKGMIFLFVFSLISVILIQTTSARMLLLWNGSQASIPSGWICRSCWVDIEGDMFPDIFTSKYLRINTSSLSTGGSATHTHTYTTVSSVDGTSSALAAPINSFDVASSIHTHNSLNVTATRSNTSLPVTRELLIIEYNSSSLPTTIPAKSIAFFNSTSAPAGFISYVPEDGYFIETDSDGLAGTVLGQERNNHTNQVVKTGAPTGLGVAEIGTKIQLGTTTHTHLLTNKINWTDADHTPLFVDLPMIYATADTTIPLGLIAIFNQTPSGNYSVWTSEVGYYIRGNMTSFNTTGGNATHNHGNLTNLGTETGAGINTQIGTTSFGTGGVHTVNISTGNATNLPPYRDVILATSNGSQETATTTCWSYVGGEFIIPSSCQCVYCGAELKFNLSDWSCGGV
jgi:hypothetical protein